MGVGALSWGNLWDTTLAHLEKSDWQSRWNCWLSRAHNVKYTLKSVYR